MPIKIEIVQGDITNADTEVIVNAANNEFWMGSGVAGAIKTAGGDVIEEEAMHQGPKMPGEAVFTGAGRLPFKGVIHGAVMGQGLKTTDKLIRQTTVACLVLAEKKNVSSLAFPAFGTGVGGFPLKACARIMLTAARSFEAQAKSLERVVFCLFDDVATKVFRDIWAELQRPPQ